MQLFQNYHHHKLYKMIHKDFWLFDFSIWLHVFARSLVAVFIPIFLLQLGFQIEEVLLYYVILHGFNVPLNFAAGALIRRFGARRMIMLGVIFLIIFLVSLINLTAGSWWFLIMMAFCAAWYDALYWVGHIFLFMKCSAKDEDVTKDASALYIVKQVAGIMAPFFGAAVLIFFTQNVLLTISIVILCLSFWPLFKIKHIDDRSRQKLKSPSEFFDKLSMVKDYVFLGLYSIHSSVESVIWPIFIYLIFKNMESVAALPIIISISTIIFTYLTGRIDKRNRNSMIALGAFMIAVVWVVRMNFDQAVFYYASVFLIAFFTILITLPLDSEMFERGERRDPLSTAMYRNATSMFARVILFFALLVLVNVFEVSFIAAAVSMVVLTLINLFVKLKIPRSIAKKKA